MESQVNEKAITIREYSRLLGISDTSVHKAINAGYITEASWTLNEKGKRLLYPSRANAEWKENYNPTRSQLTKAGKLFTLDEMPTAPPVAPSAPIAPAPAQAPIAPPQQPTAPPPQYEIPTDTEVPKGELSVAKLKQISEKLKIAKAQIELKEMQGTLVPKKEVYDAFFTFGQEMRQALLAIPDRIIDEIMATPERAVAHNILTDALMKALESLADMGSREITKRK